MTALLRRVKETEKAAGRGKGIGDPKHPSGTQGESVLFLRLFLPDVKRSRFHKLNGPGVNTNRLGRKEKDMKNRFAKKQYANTH